MERAPVIIVVSHNNASEGAPLQAAKLADALGQPGQTGERSTVLLSLSSGANPDPRFELLGSNPLARLLEQVRDCIAQQNRDVVLVLNTVVACQCAGGLRAALVGMQQRGLLRSRRVSIVGVIHELRNQTFAWVGAAHLAALQSLVFVSRFSADSFPPEMAPGVPRRVVRNWLTAEEKAGIDRAADAEPRDCFTVLACGVVAQHKRQLQAARAVGLLARRRPELRIHLRVVGTVYDTNYADAIERAAPGRVTVVGAAPHAEVLRRMASCMALVHCAAMESCSLVLLEAMYSGAPVLAARAGGTPEQIEHGVCGLLYDHGTDDEPELIANALAALADDAEGRAALGAAAREAALRRFDRDEAVAMYLAAVEDARRAEASAEEDVVA
jgi:glycosyltransferase involved in cell wall biosynthesis